MTCTELGTPAPIARLEKRRIMKPKIQPSSPTCFSGDWIPGDVCLLSSGRSLAAARSGEAASNSRHGALEPGAGLRFALASIAAFSFPIASKVGGITEAVTRLPPDPGPSGNLES